jgi:hypothetical protein
MIALISKLRSTMARHHILLPLVVLCVSWSFASRTESIAAQDKKASPGGAGDKHEQQFDRGTYRLKVEQILEPVGDMAIYRVQIWTHGEREVSLSYGRMFTHQGTQQREADGPLWRADFVVLARLREPLKGAKKTECEFRIMVNGTESLTEMSKEVDVTAKLANILELPRKQGVYKLGANQYVGRFLGTSLSVVAE